MYWVGPILGGILAAAMYEYLYCPDLELKKYCKETLIKDPSGKYKEVECSINQQVGEQDDITISPGSSSYMEKGEKKEALQDMSGDGLTPV